MLFHLLILQVLAGASGSSAVTLDGRHPFRLGDDPAWAEQAFDDSAWDKVAVPASWNELRMPLEPATGWYRLHVRVSLELLQRPLGLSIGPISDADEVFVNGVRIGGAGRFGRRFVNAAWMRRYYSIPAGVLAPDVDNVIAVRVQRTWHEGGIAGPVLLGDAGLMELDVERFNHRVRLLEMLYLAFYAASILFCLFLWMSGVWEDQYRWFAAALLVTAVPFAHDSQFLYLSGFKSPLLQDINSLFAAAGTLVFFQFVASLYHRQLSRRMTALLWGVSLLNWLAWTLVPFSLAWICVSVYGLLSLTICATTVIWSIQAIRRGLPDAWPLFLGVGSATVANALIIVGVPGVERVGGVTIDYHSSIFFLVVAMFVLARRFQRARQQARKTSMGILVAHEEERKRLAREIHDGVVQSLLAVKLKLEMMQALTSGGAAASADEIGELAQETSRTIGELRQVSMDLRPALLEDLGLEAALEWHVRHVSERSGMEIELHSDIDGTLAARTTDHLYRIIQECLNNIVKHAEASRVGLRLHAEGAWLRVEIEDNGAGFDMPDRSHSATGIGMSTIVERAELLGGWAIIESSRGRGTIVRIAVPADKE